MEMLSPTFTLFISSAKSPNATAFISTSIATSARPSRCVDWWISVRFSAATPPGVALSVSRDATFPSSTVWFLVNSSFQLLLEVREDLSRFLCHFFHGFPGLPPRSFFNAVTHVD